MPAEQLISMAEDRTEVPFFQNHRFRFGFGYVIFVLVRGVATSVIVIANVCLCFLLITMSKTLAVTTAETYGLVWVALICATIYGIFWKVGYFKVSPYIILGAMDM